MFLWYRNCSRKVKLSSRLLSMVSQFCVHQRVVPLWKHNFQVWTPIKDHSRFCVEREISATGSWFARTYTFGLGPRVSILTLRKSSHGASLSRSAMQSIFNFHIRTRGYGCGCGIMRLFSCLSTFFLPTEVFRIGGLLSAFSRSLYYAADTAENK